MERAGVTERRLARRRGPLAPHTPKMEVQAIAERLVTTARANTDYTLEDILRILREQYEVWEAVRREILPASLLEMPQ